MSKKQAAKAKKQTTKIVEADPKAKSKTKTKTKTKAKTESNSVPVGTTETEPTEVSDDEEPTLTLDVTVTRETLDGTPVRVLTFLKGIGTSASIHAAMAARGYSREHHLQGWALLHNVSGYQDAAIPEEDPSARNAIKALDDWDEDGFQIIAASLRHRFPEQAAFLLSGLSPATGAAAVLGVKTLLDRLDALSTATVRQSTRSKDEAALLVLAQRGIGEAERKHLRDLIATAESAPELSLPDAEAIARSEANYLKRLMALRAWFEEWSGIARVAIKRRDYLIRLGLAKRRVSAVEPSPAAETTANVSVTKTTT